MFEKLVPVCPPLKINLWVPMVDTRRTFSFFILNNYLQSVITKTISTLYVGKRNTGLSL